jgi:hypothetical protein
MEYSDVDALQKVNSTDGHFSITMKNEALETHCINAVNLLAFPTEAQERVYQTRNNQFFLSDATYPLLKAQATEGDITTLLQHSDRVERFSLSDPDNLCSKEAIFLEFDANTTAETELGLVLNFRQTLMTTYLIYSAMGYMGDAVGDIFADIERKNTNSDIRFKGKLHQALGEVDIFAWNSAQQTWEPCGSLYETGPIAFNKQVVPLKWKRGKDSTIRLKLVLNQGLWRIDQAALVRLKAPVQPTLLSPVSVLHRGDQDKEALHDLLRPDRYLVSMPGEAYRFNFQLPQPNQE